VGKYSDSSTIKSELVLFENQKYVYCKLFFSGAVQSSLLYSIDFHHNKKRTAAEAARRGGASARSQILKVSTHDPYYSR